MGRKIMATVDYFPHDVDASERMTLSIIENRHGITGYAVWFKLLERLGATENHFIDMSNTITREFTATKMRISAPEMIKIIDSLSELGAIDQELWAECQVVWCQRFVDNLSNVYQKRKLDLPQRPTHLLENIRTGNAISAPEIPGNDDNRVEGTQSIVDKSKEEKSNKRLCVNPTKPIHTYSEEFEVFWSEYPIKKEKLDAFKAWKKIKPNEELQETILSAVQQQKEWRESRLPGEFIPEWKHPTTWLNKGCWEDEVTHHAGASNRRTGRYAEEGPNFGDGADYPVDVE